MLESPYACVTKDGQAYEDSDEADNARTQSATQRQFEGRAPQDIGPYGLDPALRGTPGLDGQLTFVARGQAQAVSDVVVEHKLSIVFRPA